MKYLDEYCCHLRFKKYTDINKKFRIYSLKVMKTYETLSPKLKETFNFKIFHRFNYSYA